MNATTNLGITGSAFTQNVAVGGNGGQANGNTATGGAGGAAGGGAIAAAARDRHLASRRRPHQAGRRRQPHHHGAQRARTTPSRSATTPPPAAAAAASAPPPPTPAAAAVTPYGGAIFGDATHALLANVLVRPLDQPGPQWHRHPRQQRHRRRRRQLPLRHFQHPAGRLRRRRQRLRRRASHNLGSLVVSGSSVTGSVARGGTAGNIATLFGAIGDGGNAFGGGIANGRQLQVTQAGAAVPTTLVLNSTTLGATGTTAGTSNGNLAFGGNSGGSTSSPTLTAGTQGIGRGGALYTSAVTQMTLDNLVNNTAQGGVSANPNVVGFGQGFGGGLFIDALAPGVTFRMTLGTATGNSATTQGGPWYNLAGTNARRYFVTHSGNAPDEGSPDIPGSS